MRGLLLIGLTLAAASGARAGQDTGHQAEPPEARGSDTASGAGPRGRIFISPMGEPFHGDSPDDAWFTQADANRDGALSRQEMVDDAARFFAVLDRRRDGEIDPDDIDYYETVLAPEIRVGGMGGGGARGGGERRGGGRRGGGGGRRGGGMEGGGGQAGGGQAQAAANIRQGAARFGYLDYPQPVTAADRNFNRGIDASEFAQAASERFAVLDRNSDGKIEKAELPTLRSSSHPGARGRGRRTEP
jgi:hypothetical protein